MSSDHQYHALAVGRVTMEVEVRHGQNESEALQQAVGSSADSDYHPWLKGMEGLVGKGRRALPNGYFEVG
jgi:hypothetical protein